MSDGVTRNSAHGRQSHLVPIPAPLPSSHQLWLMPTSPVALCTRSIPQRPFFAPSESLCFQNARPYTTTACIAIYHSTRPLGRQ